MTWHSSLAAQVQDSHIQLVGAPINIVYEEGTAIGSGLTSSYAAITKVTIGMLYKLLIILCKEFHFASIIDQAVADIYCFKQNILLLSIFWI